MTQEQAEDVGPVIGALLDRDEATAEALVRRAKSRRSPAHKHFEWDDEIAAHQHRLTRAREYLRGIVLVRVTFETGSDAGEVPIRLVHDPNPEDGVPRYRSEEDAARSEALAERILAEAMRGLAGWVDRYGWLADAAGDSEGQRVIRQVRALLP